MTETIKHDKLLGEKRKWDCCEQAASKIWRVMNLTASISTKENYEHKS
jgi:hypothetical protein